MSCPKKKKKRKKEKKEKKKVGGRQKLNRNKNSEVERYFK